MFRIASGQISHETLVLQCSDTFSCPYLNQRVYLLLVEGWCMTTMLSLLSRRMRSFSFPYEVVINKGIRSMLVLFQ